MDKIFANKWLHIFLLLILLVVSVAFNFSSSRWREQIRNFTFDNYNIFKPRISSDSVIIVDIDESSLKEIGQMPWPRSIMADLVQKLYNMGAAVIAFDIVFSEPDRSSPSFIVKTLGDLGKLSGIAQKLDGLPDNDVLFGEAIKNAGNIVTGFSFTNEGTDIVPAQKGIFRGQRIERFVPTLAGATANLKEISKDAAGNGSFFVSTDIDGIIRRVPMLVAHTMNETNIISIYPSLALETIRVYEGERGGQVILADQRYADLDPHRFGIKGIQIGKNKGFIPTNGRGEFLTYFSKSNPDWYISARDILKGEYIPEKIQGKIVLIGTSAVGLKDIRSTPLDTFIPGVEVHLNIIDQILQKKFLIRPIEAEGLEAVSIFTIGLLIIIFSSFIGAAAQAVIVTAAISLAVFTGWYAFNVHGLLIDITYPSFSILAIFMLSTILTYLRTEKERQAVRQAFGLYISPDFMRELTRDPDKLRLGGENRELTVMFTDIRKFTTISEGLKPEELIQLMNDFLTPMSDLVMKNRGTIDKYMGDAMMAFWNAPLDDPEHARHACLTALEMKLALKPVNNAIEAKAIKEGKEPVFLKAGIGINTGLCAVGNMGSKQRFAYSVLGDAANLASRLENLTKIYGVDIIIGESTCQNIKEFAVLELDLIQVHGKTKPIHIYTVIGDSALAAGESFQNLKNIHQEMMEFYKAGNFKEAIKLNSQCIEMNLLNMNKFYLFYKDRLEKLTDNPPSQWDGIYVAKTK